MKLSFLKLLINNEFYEKNKQLLVEEMFPDQLILFYKAAQNAHAKYKRNITIDELGALVVADNPMLTRAQRELVEHTTSLTKLEPDIGQDVGSDLLQVMWREEIGRQISSAGIDLVNGTIDLSTIQSLVSGVSGTFIPSVSTAPTTTDLDELLSILDNRSSWHFNIPKLNAAIPGISSGEFIGIFARPEVGKTGAWVSFACAPEGWCWQGASVHAIVNEEPSIRTMLRCVCAATGMSKEEVRENRKVAKDTFDKIKANLTIIDDVDMSMDKLDAYAKQHKPDIIILDQIDKVSVRGSFMRTDEELGETYLQFRRSAKRHGFAGVALTQASADAEGKMVLHYSMMAGSKTSKAAELDAAIGIGKCEELSDPKRYLTLSKNKIGGIHTTIPCIFNNKISTLYP